MIQEILADGQLWRMLATLALIVAVTALERVAVTRGWPWYFDATGALVEQPLPIPRGPASEGEDGGIRWARHGDGLRWWVERGARGAPGGLHGLVALAPSRGGVGHGVDLRFRWCPPWTPFLALAWFAGLGAVESRALMTWPLAAVLAGGIFLVYQQAAVRVAARLRYRWARDPDGAEER